MPRRPKSGSAVCRAERAPRTGRAPLDEIEALYCAGRPEAAACAGTSRRACERVLPGRARADRPRVTFVEQRHDRRSTSRSIGSRNARSGDKGNRKQYRVSVAIVRLRVTIAAQMTAERVAGISPRGSPAR